MELQQQHNAMLQMYGEKVEQVDELRMDIQDVKEMYKTQVSFFLSFPSFSSHNFSSFLAVSSVGEQIEELLRKQS
jgi:hypothetical protein